MIKTDYLSHTKSMAFFGFDAAFHRRVRYDVHNHIYFIWDFISVLFSGNGVMNGSSEHSNIGTGAVR